MWNGSQLRADIGPEYSFYFNYNALGEMIGFTYRLQVDPDAGAPREYEHILVKNQQGDVEKVIRTVDQEIVASYTYDAWGNILTATGTLAERNPIRYRGYYYDTETGFYYLQSRYYDPQTGRFINADDPGMLGADGDLQSYNLYAYCLNNPVNREDEGGTFSFTVTSVLVGGVVGGFIGGVSAALRGESTKEIIKYTITGTISGGGSAWNKVGVVAAGMLNSIITYRNAKGTVGQRFLKAVVAGGLTCAGGMIGGKINSFFGQEVNSTMIWGHVVTDINVGCATEIISESAQMVLSDSSNTSLTSRSGYTYAYLRREAIIA